MRTVVKAPTPLHALFAADILSRAIRVALRLGVPDALGDSALPIGQFAERLGVKPDRLYRLLRPLAYHGYFEELPEQHFRHTEMSRMLRDDHPRSLRPMLLLSDLESHDRAWRALPQAMRTEQAPFEIANGLPLFKWLAEHRDDATIFNQAMVQNTLPMAQRFLEEYPEIRDSDGILDVAGGLGQLLTIILQAHSHLRGAVFDLPAVEASALAYLKAAGLTQRASFHSGSFLEAIPQGFDTYIIKNTLWNWRDADCQRILQNVRKALGARKGRLLIIEPVIAGENAGWASLMDLQMLVMPNGRGRTQNAYQDLLGASRWNISRVLDIGDSTLLECTPLA